jgi:hypothetical protein
LIVENFDEPAIERQFFSLAGLRKLDPNFEFPGYGFNTGQIVVTTGHITKQDFEGLVDWQTRTVRHPEIFKMGEQGVLNYIALRKVQQGKLTIRREPFMAWPGEPSRADHIQLKDINPEGRHRQLIHWAGLRWGKTIEEMPKPEMLLHFEEIYYQRIPLGAWLRKWRHERFRIQRTFITPLKNVAKRLLSKLI